MKKILVLLLTVCLLAGCAPKAAEIAGENLMENIKPGAVAFTEEELPTAAVTDFAVRLLRESAKSGENTLISPLSVLYALSMTANGADGNTLAQMETVRSVQPRPSPTQPMSTEMASVTPWGREPEPP